MTETAEGSMRYAGGQECPACGEILGIADRYFRWCGERLRRGDEGVD